ncbi:MAG: HEAT repeat domain-containing protein [Planctomycetales bacterium]|nr:HEAT repeat domain-containing protein [Planctomycetales bacterium]
MRGLGLVLALVAAPASAGGPDEETASTTGEELARATLVGVGAVESVRSLQTVTVAHVRLEEVLKGDEKPGATVLVLTSDPRRYRAGEKLLLFLGALSDPGLSGRYRDLARHALGNPEGDERLEVLRGYLRVQAIPDEAARLEALRAMLLSNLRDGREWTRWNAVRECFVLAARDPPVLRAEDLAALRALLAQPVPMKKSLRWHVLATLTRATLAPLLARALGAAEPGDRARAVTEIAAVADPRRDDLLAQRLAAEDDAGRRARLAEICGALGGDLLRGALRARLREDGEPAVRTAAALALTWCDPSAGDALLQTLREDRSAAVRAMAALLLARLRDRRAVGPLRSLLASRPALPLAIAAGTALERLEAP